jgi:hypothetical protein
MVSASERKDGVDLSLTMKLGNRRSRARVITLAVATTVICRTVGGCAFIASQFRGCRFSSRQIEEISGVGRIIQVAVEPPLFEGIVGQRCDGSIIVRERCGSDVVSPHGRGEQR